MCIYTVKKQFKKKIYKKYRGGGFEIPPNVPKLGVSGIKDTAKLTKIEVCHVAYC